MKNFRIFIMLTLMLVLSVPSLALSAESSVEDPGWHRLVQVNGKELVIYQSQMDY